MHVVELSDLASEEFGLTPRTGGAMAEAASVCLYEREHGIEVELDQLGAFEGEDVRLKRLEVDRAMWSSHRDETKATYEGGEGIALLLLTEVGDVRTFSRARKGNGFDYWFSEDPTCDFPLTDFDAGRLEVSGIRQGSKRDVERRHHTKR